MVVLAMTAPLWAGDATFSESDMAHFSKLWGGTGANLETWGASAGGYELDGELATNEFGKLAIGWEPESDSRPDWSGATDFYLKVELLSASNRGGDTVPNAIELKPFIQTGDGYQWYESPEYNLFGLDDESTYSEFLATDGATFLGDSGILHWDLSGVDNLNDVRKIGFQMYTSGWWDTESSDGTRPAMDATVRVSPVPEPATMLVLGLGGAVLAWKKKRR